LETLIPLAYPSVRFIEISDTNKVIGSLTSTIGDKGERCVSVAQLTDGGYYIEFTNVELIGAKMETTVTNIKVSDEAADVFCAMIETLKATKGMSMNKL